MVRSALAALLLAGALALPATVSATGLGAPPFGETALPAPSFDEPVRTSFFITLRDGVRVAVELYRPATGGQAAAGRFPVIWQHTIDRRPRSPDSAKKTDGGELGLGSVAALARYGYVVALVERRGNGASFGVRRGYHDRNEAHDAYEITEWLATQGWSDGKVGIYGCSNTGDAAMHAVSVAPPHLKAAFAGCFSWNKYDAMMRGGIFAQWGTGPSRTIEMDMQNLPVDGDEGKVLLRQAAEEHQLSTPLLPLWSGMPFRDSHSPMVHSRFWYEGSASSYAPQIARSGIPVYVLGGWLDDFRKEGLVAYANLPADKRRILIGNWRHCRNDGFNLLAEMKRFFDAELKGTAPLTDAPIHYFTVNAPAERAWKAAATWPVAGTTQLALYPGAPGKMAERPGSKGRVAVPFKAKPQCPGLPADQPPGSSAGWVACPDPDGAAGFDAPPVTTDTEITGHPLAELTLTVDDTDADVFVYLQDVAPDGTAETMTEGRLRLSLRELGTAPYDVMGLPWRRQYAADAAPLKPGSTVSVTVDMLPISWNLRAGHRLRVLATASDYRERDPLVGGKGFAIVTGKGASRILVPVVK